MHILRQDQPTEFAKTCVSAAALTAISGGLATPSFANLAGFSIPGEQTPSYEASRWVTGTNHKDLDPYRHSDIKFIAYHHEGFANADQSLFNTVQPKKRKQSALQRVQIIHDGHVKKGYGMIAYHYAVSPEGEIVKGRPLQFGPATGSTDPRTNKIANFDGHFAVVAMADFEFEQVADREKQIFAMIKVMSKAQRDFRVASVNIRPHKDHVSFEGRFGSSCPGKNLYAIRDSIRDRTLAMSLQSELAARNCYAGRIDGDFGRRSKTGLAKLSSAHRDLGALAFDDKTLWRLLDHPTKTCV